MYSVSWKKCPRIPMLYHQYWATHISRYQGSWSDGSSYIFCWEYQSQVHAFSIQGVSYHCCFSVSCSLNCLSHFGTLGRVPSKNKVQLFCLTPTPLWALEHREVALESRIWKLPKVLYFLFDHLKHLWCMWDCFKLFCSVFERFT